jgi:hypothetical protein
MTIRQTDPKLNMWIKKYGCLFMSLAYASGKEYGASQLNLIWDTCVAKGWITGDLNHDGDLDDANEAIIVDHDAVAKALGAKLAYTNKHYPPETPIPYGYYAVGQFYNPRTKFKHFVVIDREKKVVYDPIPDSVTVREGYLYSIRLYKIL